MEFEALKWAALYLIPPHNLAYTLKCGITEKDQLAKWFNVTETMIDFRLKLLEDET